MKRDQALAWLRERAKLRRIHLTPRPAVTGHDLLGRLLREEAGHDDDAVIPGRGGEHLPEYGPALLQGEPLEDGGLRLGGGGSGQLELRRTKRGAEEAALELLLGHTVGNRAEPGKDADAPVLEVADEPPGPLPGLVGNILLLRVGQPLSRQVQEQPRLVPLDQDLEGRVYLPARASLQLAHEGGVVRRLARR